VHGSAGLLGNKMAMARSKPETFVYAPSHVLSLARLGGFEGGWKKKLTSSPGGTFWGDCSNRGPLGLSPGLDATRGDHSRGRRCGDQASTRENSGGSLATVTLRLFEFNGDGLPDF